MNWDEYLATLGFESGKTFGNLPIRRRRPSRDRAALEIVLPSGPFVVYFSLRRGRRGAILIDRILDQVPVYLYFQPLTGILTPARRPTQPLPPLVSKLEGLGWTWGELKSPQQRYYLWGLHRKDGLFFPVFRI